MIIIAFSLLFLAVFIATNSYTYVERYYGTVLYVSLIAIVYELICVDYGMWLFPTWWIFTNQASAVFQALVLFPSTTVLFLRYMPSRIWYVLFHFILFITLYVLMEWLMLQNVEIRYAHGWSFLWSVVIDILMFLMIWIHEYSHLLAWALTIPIIVSFIAWFQVPFLIL